MRCQLAFSVAKDGRLLVYLVVSPSARSNLSSLFTATAFEDENTFIYGAVLAQLNNAETVQIISAVLLTMSGRNPGTRWIGIELSEEQLATLGLEACVCPVVNAASSTGSFGTTV